MKVQPSQKKRQEAIRLHQSGKSISEVCRQLGCSRPWFYKWKKRWESGESDWYLERSRRPHCIANKTEKEKEKVVVEIRKRLDQSKYSQRGALAIQWEMEKLGLDPLPTWTIDRILKRHHLVREKKAYQPKGKSYPNIKQIFSESIQQADLIGPRYIKNDGRFYSLSVIDLESYLVTFNPCRNKTDEAMAQGLLRTWKTIGKPDFLQLDNELSFRGSNRYPHSLGLVLRMCLSLGIQTIFIPIGEPWRNGTVEKLQDIFDKMFYRRQHFSSYQNLKKQTRCFETFRNQNHRCSGIGNQIPVEWVKNQEIQIEKLSTKVTLKTVDFSLSDGYIHLIRFVRSDLQIDIFGEKFKVPKRVQYEYVIATICTKTQILKIQLDQQMICSFEYRIPVEYHRNV
jgi:transposase-like protein